MFSLKLYLVQVNSKLIRKIKEDPYRHPLSRQRKIHYYSLSMRGHIRAQESKEMYQRMFYMGKVVVMAISYFLSFFAVAIVIA